MIHSLGRRKPQRERIVVGVSGASGVIYAVRLLEILREIDIETHVVISRAAKLTLAHETSLTLAELRGLADVVYPTNDVAAAISSGSFRTCGMVIAPCSVRMLSEIATGTGESLLARAADVTLKERRPLVLVVRESPLHLGHIRAMASATEMGAIIFPPVPAFYAKPQNLTEMVDHTIGRVLDLFGIETTYVSRWQGM